MTALQAKLFTVEQDFTADPSRQRRGLEMLLENTQAIVLVAAANHRLIGMCSGQLLISTAEGGFSLLVEDVVVTQAWQGKGAGTSLLKKLEEWALHKRVKRLQLLADLTNSKALSFYQNLNWHQTRLICLHKKPITGT